MLRGLLILSLIILLVNTTLLGQKPTMTITVEKGQTFTSIYKKFQMTKQELMDLNHLKSDNLRLGQKLLVYAKNPTYLVEKGDNLKRIAEKFKISKSDILKLNKIENENIKIGQKLLIPINSSSDLKKTIETNEKPLPVNSKKLIEVKEKCIATWVNDDDLIHTKAIALHNKAPFGTIIKVINVMNGKSFNVKVVGTIPSSQFQEDIGVEITKTIAEKLGVVDKYFRAEVQYVKESTK